MTWARRRVPLDKFIPISNIHCLLFRCGVADEEGDGRLEGEGDLGPRRSPPRPQRRGEGEVQDKHPREGTGRPRACHALPLQHLESVHTGIPTPLLRQFHTPEGSHVRSWFLW